MRGYKATDADAKCRGYQFTPGWNKLPGRVYIGRRGFHFCAMPVDIAQYYNWLEDTSIRIWEVEATGDIVTMSDCAAATQLRFIREIARDEMLQLCTGTFTRPNGGCEHYRHGLLHRDDGPAVVTATGTEIYYQWGQRHRTDGPALRFADGAETWCQRGQWHREGGPAVMNADGSQMWYRHGEAHRDDGPAKTYPDGTQLWYRNGVQCSA